MLCGIDAIPPAADDGARDDFGDGDEFGETLLFGTIITQSARWKNTATAPRVNGTRRLTSVYHENARLPPDRVLPRAYPRHGIGEAPATGAIKKTDPDKNRGLLHINQRSPPRGYAPRTRKRGYQLRALASPPSQVAAARQISRSIVLLTKWTEPSIMDALTPPE